MPATLVPPQPAHRRRALICYAAAAALTGLRPTVVAIIAAAAWRLGRANLHSPWHFLAAAICAGLLFHRVCSPVVLILLGIVVGLGLHRLRRPRSAS